MNFTELIKKQEERRAALVAQSEASEDVKELRSIQKQIEAINETIAEMRAAQAQQETEKNSKCGGAGKGKDKQGTDERTAAVTGAEAPEKRSAEGTTAPGFIPGSGFKPAEGRASADYSKVLESREKAGGELKENRAVNSDIGIFGEVRAVTVGDGTSIAVPQQTSSTINQTFGVVSSLIDGVDHLTLVGGESFRQPYVDSIISGGYTAEGEASKDADTKYAYADISKTKVTAYSEVSEELLKLPNAPYADNVFQNVRTSMRMVVSKEILVGAGGTNQMVGIFTAKATAIDATTDLEITTIDDTTLDEIVFRYGGGEEVEGAAVLILNKLDLLAFAKVRTSTKQKFYDIKSNGNSGTINGIPFIINSACHAVTGKDTKAADYCMAYGNLMNYKVVEFSPVEVKRSEDYKFKEGMIANRGVVMAGGNVVHKNGFLRVKRGATA